jgi:hypothetical protein
MLPVSGDDFFTTLESFDPWVRKASQVIVKVNQTTTDARCVGTGFLLRPRTISFTRQTGC